MADVLNSVPFLGLRGVQDFQDNELPGEWRRGVYQYDVSGDTPFYAMTAMMPTEETSEYEFNFWEEFPPEQRAPVSTLGGGSTPSGSLTTYAVATYGIDGGIVTVNIDCSADPDMIQQFRRDHVVLLRKSGDSYVDTAGIILSVANNGASSRIVIRLIQADQGNASANTTHNLGDVDVIQIIGTAMTEGSTIPDAITYGALSRSNYVQMQENSWALTHRELKAQSRLGDPKQRARAIGFNLHRREIERSLLFGVKTSYPGENGKLKTTTDGMRNLLRTYAANSCGDFQVENPGSTWKAGGWDWFLSYMQNVFLYGSPERLVFQGSGVNAAFVNIAQHVGNIQLTPGVTDWGLRVNRLITPWGTLLLKSHPLMSQSPEDRNSMLVMPDMEGFVLRTMQDTVLREDPTTVAQVLAGGAKKIEESYLSDMGLEYKGISTGGYLTGVGLDGPSVGSGATASSL